MATPGIPACTEDEFIELWNRCSGSTSQVAKALGIHDRKVNSRRRAIERRRGILLLNHTGHYNSPDSSVLKVEFPDWQTLDIKDGLLVMFSDAHLMPGHKSTAHRALLKLIQELKPKAIVEGGDLMDFASIARHHRIGWDEQLDPQKELEWAGDCLEEIKKLSKSSIHKRLQGNHDQRFSGYFSNIAGRMGRVKGNSLQDHLVGWPVSWAIRVNEDQLELKHRFRSGIHAPYNNTLNAGISYATGHLHSQKVYPLTDLRGDRWGCDVGTLSAVYGPHFRYLEASPRNWRSGFAVFRFVNRVLRQPQLVRVVDEEGGIVEYLDKDFTV